MSNCRLDILPVELIHHLFNYFSAHEIFYTFINVSSYLNVVLLNYPYYQMNFKSITKMNFDLVCQHINPRQVIALTLADTEDTPGQTELFLSRFQIKQFIHLQSLRLIEVNKDFWENIMTQLIELKNLRAFHFFNPSRSYSWILNISESDVTQLDIRLSQEYAPILSQLHRLRLTHGDFLKSVQFPSLQHLILQQSTVDIIKHISSVAPHLQSLDTEFSHYGSNNELIFPFTQLNRLVLRIVGSSHSMDDMERLISNLRCLKHLQLSANCLKDVVNGDRWQVQVMNLLTFKFLFNLSDECELHDLDSFRTLFWLEEKQWYVAYRHKCLFSVPYFNQSTADENVELPLYSTVPANHIFYDCIVRLDLSKLSGQFGHFFNHVQTLSLDCSFTVSSLEKVVYLDHIEHLILKKLRVNSPIKRLINKMSKLCKLTIECNLERFLTTVKFNALREIRILHIHTLQTSNIKDIIEQLSLVFPNIDRLHVYETCSIIEIIDFLDQFKHLSVASFRYGSFYHDSIEAQEKRLIIQSVLDQERHCHKFNYTYRFDHRSIHIWIQ